MNNRLWVTLVAVTFVSMAQAGSLTKQALPSYLDTEAIEREAAAALRAFETPSPHVAALEQLGALCDTLDMLREKDPTSPKINATKEAIKNQFIPPLTLTKQIQSPKIQPRAIRISDKR